MISIFKRYRSENQHSSADQEQTEETHDQNAAQVAVKPLSAGEQKEKQQKRYQDRQLFHQLMAGLYDGILIIDIHGCLIQTNQRARDFFGYSEADLWNVKCTQLIPQLNAQVIFKIISHISENRHTVLNATCKRQDGTQFPGEIAISNICMINDNDLVLAVRNCEKRINAQKTNQVRSEAVEFAGAGIVSCSDDGNIKYANPAFLKMVQAQNPQEVTRHKIGDFCTNNDQLKELTDSPSLQSTWYGKLNMTTMKGTPLHVQATSVLAETYSNKKAKRSLIITMTLVPDKAVRATVK